MNKTYRTSKDIEAFLPSVELLERSRDIIEEAIGQIGRLTVESILGMSAIEVAGVPERGKKGGEIYHYGSQSGNVKVGGKRVQVERPRLRSKEGKEVKVPAYEILKDDPKSGQRALERVLKGVSSREYQGVFDEASKELGLSKSQISREFVEASERALKELTQRQITSRQLAIMVDGIHIGSSIVLVAIGINSSGSKSILGIQEGATENSAAVGSLLSSIIDKGVNPDEGILFVLDGAKALTKSVNEYFPCAQIQRCRVHKMRNVLEHLPESKRNYIKAKMNLAYRLSYQEALTKLQELAKELEVNHPGAAASLREGLEQTLTMSRLAVSPLLTASLCTTNLIESSFSRARARMRKVTNFTSGQMVLRWCASALVLAEQNFRTIKGVKDMWMLQSALDNQLEIASN